MSFRKTLVVVAALLPLAIASPVPTLTAVAPTSTATLGAAPEQTHLIHPGNDDSLCLAVVNPKPDAPTQFLPCAGTAASGDTTGTFAHWVLVPGDNLSVRLEGFELCLDAGSVPGNNGPAKVYTCYPGLAQQHWYYTSDNRLALTGGSQCLDRTGGTGAPQTYQCTAGNTNQVFVTADVGSTTSEFAAPTVTLVGGSHPATSVGGTRPVTSVGGSPTVTLVGGSNPVTSIGGSHPVTSVGGSHTVTSVAEQPIPTSCTEENCGIPGGYTTSALLG